MRLETVIYDEAKNIIWICEYFGWVEGYMLTSPGNRPLRLMEAPAHFHYLGRL